jgi:hypothetical protein
MNLLYPTFDRQCSHYEEVLLSSASHAGSRINVLLPKTWVRTGNYQAEAYILDPVLLRLFRLDYLGGQKNTAVIDPEEALYYVSHTKLSWSSLITAEFDDDDDLEDEDSDDDDEWMDEEFDDDDEDMDDEDFDDEDFDDEDFEDFEDEDWENDFEESEDDEEE